MDPAMLDPMKLTGEENVSVVNRVTGKRVGYMFKIPTIKINLLKMLEITFLMFFFTIFDQFICFFLHDSFAIILHFQY